MSHSEPVHQSQNRFLCEERARLHDFPSREMSVVFESRARHLNPDLMRTDFAKYGIGTSDFQLIAMDRFVRSNKALICPTCNGTPIAK